jgi:hypothetical protein
MSSLQACMHTNTLVHRVEPVLPSAAHSMVLYPQLFCAHWPTHVGSAPPAHLPLRHTWSMHVKTGAIAALAVGDAPVRQRSSQPTATSGVQFFATQLSRSEHLAYLNAWASSGLLTSVLVLSVPASEPGVLSPEEVSPSVPSAGLVLSPIWPSPLLFVSPVVVMPTAEVGVPSLQAARQASEPMHASQVGRNRSDMGNLACGPGKGPARAMVRQSGPPRQVFRARRGEGFCVVRRWSSALTRWSSYLTSFVRGSRHPHPRALCNARGAVYPAPRLPPGFPCA